MSWGHAVSNDLFSWKELDVAMTPDQYGTAYSGCGLVDRKNTAGCGQDALLFFYTAAGGRNEKAVMAMLDMDTLKESKNQSEDIKKALEDVKK